MAEQLDNTFPDDPALDAFEVATQALVIFELLCEESSALEVFPKDLATIEQRARFEAADRRKNLAQNLFHKAEDIAICTQPQTITGAAALVTYIANMIERGADIGRDEAKALRAAAHSINRKIQAQ